MWYVTVHLPEAQVPLNVLGANFPWRKSSREGARASWDGLFSSSPLEFTIRTITATTIASTTRTITVVTMQLFFFFCFFSRRSWNKKYYKCECIKILISLNQTFRRMSQKWKIVACWQWSLLNQYISKRTYCHINSCWTKSLQYSLLKKQISILHLLQIYRYNKLSENNYRTINRTDVTIIPCFRGFGKPLIVWIDTTYGFKNITIQNKLINLIK